MDRKVHAQIVCHFEFNMRTVEREYWTQKYFHKF